MLNQSDYAIEPPLKQPHIVKTAAFWPGLVTSILLLPTVLIAPIVLLILIIRVDDAGTWSGWLLGLAIMCGLIYFLFRITMALRRELFARLQADRDRFANDIADALLAGRPVPAFSLYLRPFFTDGHLTADEGFARTLSFDVNEIADFGLKRDIEAAAARALEGHAPLISLGRPNDRLGAGRIETDDENWRALFELLIAHAARVIMVPIGQPATLEEVRRIVATPELLEKTIFVRPADRRNPDFRFTPDQNIKTLGRMWDWTRGQIADILPAFPSFRGGARLVTFTSDGAAIEYRGNGICTVQQPSAIRRFLVEGEARLADWLLVFTLGATLLLVEMSPIPLALPSESWDLRDQMKGLAALRFFEVALAVPLLGIGIYKLVTEDLPRRIGLPVTLSIFGVTLLSLCWAQLMSDLSDYGSFSPARVALSAAIGLNRYFIVYIAATYLTGRSIDVRHLAVLALMAIVGAVLSPQNFMGPDKPMPDFLIAIAIPRGVLFLAIAMLLPLVGAVPRRRLLPLSLAALALAGLNIAAWVYIGQPWQMEAMRNAITSNAWEAKDHYALAWDYLYAMLQASLLAILPLLAWPFIARAIAGEGRPRRWSEPLPAYG